MNSKTFSEKEQGAGSRNDARSGAKRIPIFLVFDDANLDVHEQVFYVSKAILVEGLKFIAEAPDAYVRQARARHIFSNLIKQATDHSDK